MVRFLFAVLEEDNCDDNAGRSIDDCCAKDCDFAFSNDGDLGSPFFLVPLVVFLISVASIIDFGGFTFPRVASVAIGFASDCFDDES